jgi:UDP-2-acetamido-3-amino-2,3-dideoxy-glucuronate N-acetyltransferase
LTIADNVKLGQDVKIFHPNLVNLYGCTIGDETIIGPFVEIQRGVTIGTRCKISSHSFLCQEVRIEDEVFVGYGVMFINDIYPRSTTEEGQLKGGDDWVMVQMHIRRRASIGSNATILSGVPIGENAIVGARAVVTRDVPEGTIVAGVPAREIGDVHQREPIQARE